MDLYKTLVRAGVLATAFVGFTAISQPASAVTTDTLLGSEDLANSGDQAEFDALAAILGLPDSSSLTLTLKEDFDGGNLTVDNGQFILDVTPQEPGYFILKFGTGNLGVDDTYFFQNIAELDLLVFENSQINNLFNPDDLPRETRLSHYTLVDGDTAVIPLPASLPLLLGGLAGLGFISRRRRAA